jgi:hypothetical protein
MSRFGKGDLVDEAAPAALKAKSIIREYGLRLPIELDVEAIAALRGAFVREEALKGCDGRLVKRGSHGIISVKASIVELGRKRFTIAHELGHFELHDAGTELTVCLEKDCRQWTQSSNQRETEANIFAAELLLPGSIFKPLSVEGVPNLSIIQKLAAEFRTSLQATALRYITFSPHRCSIVVSENNRIDWFKCTKDFGYWLERGTKLDPDCIATDFFSGKQLPSDMRSVLASAWIDSPRLSSRTRIQEQSWGFKNYGSVLTLLWLDDAFEGEEEQADEEEGEDSERNLIESWTPRFR